MLDMSTILKHYKRRDVQEAMVAHGKDREIAARFHDKFGSRPDILQYEQDVMEFAKRGATSFHCSEERWENPLELSPSMKKSEMVKLRSGWDLVIDVDCKNWDYAKIITHLIVKLIQSFGIKRVSVKFSGNKGFHIGVPFEVFPKSIHGSDIKTLFPDGPRRVAQYIIHLLEEKFFEMLPQKSVNDIAAALKLDPKELQLKICTYCNQKQPDEQEKFEFICPHCDERVVTEERLQYKPCPKCSKIMVQSSNKKTGCVTCGKESFKTKLDAEKILDIDTLLISSRHLYRMPYSLHEKSGLVSIPIDPNKVLEFNRENAHPDKVHFDFDFLPRKEFEDETTHLFLQSFDFSVVTSKNELIPERSDEIEIPTSAIPAEHFPNCIKKLSAGLEDGKKRALFVLINFLRSVGWDNAQVETYLRAWNKRNPEPLRENYLVGQLRYSKTKKPVLPPNCANTAYYQSLGCKCADSLCMKVKNPVNYAKRSVRFANRDKKKKEGKKDKIQKSDDNLIKKSQEFNST